MYKILKEKRVQKRLTVNAVAVLAGISPHTVNRLERGTGDARSLYKYCKFLNLKLC